MATKLSLIIPYYNTYDYTIKLLRELRLQKTDEVEVILIDDGCNETRFDEFTEFTIIHNEHVGASAAWNIGIRQATGKYIGFIDSDDMIMMNYIDVLLGAIDKELADEIMFDWVDYDMNRVIIHPTARAIWKAIYKREIVPFFDESWEYYTDLPFQAQLKAIPHTKHRLNVPLYVYRSKRYGSISWKRTHGEFGRIVHRPYVLKPQAPNIDLILPFVSANDPEWLSEYSRLTGSYTPEKNRFSNGDTLKYLFRGIAKYLPFINNVFFLVSGEGQIPGWLNRDKVRVVYHRDFIPSQFLPTFNSCTIECFLGNIPDLGEQIIYFNDDIFPINSLTSNNFFTNGLPNIHFREHEWFVEGLMYHWQCYNGLNTAADLLQRPHYPNCELLLTEHSATPILRSTLETVAAGCQDKISASITPTRNLRNINQNIYSYYQYYSGKFVDKFPVAKYLDVYPDNLAEIQDAILSKEIQLLCLNNNYQQINIAEMLEKKFPTPCIYES